MPANWLFAKDLDFRFLANYAFQEISHGGRDCYKIIVFPRVFVPGCLCVTGLQYTNPHNAQVIICLDIIDCDLVYDLTPTTGNKRTNELTSYLYCPIIVRDEHIHKFREEHIN